MPALQALLPVVELAVGDEVTREIRHFCDGWRCIAGMNDERAAEVIRQDQADVLIRKL